MDQSDPALGARFHVIDMAGLDGSDRLDVAKGLLGRPDGSETPSRTEQPLRSGTIALDEVVPPRPVNVRDAVEPGIVAAVLFADDLAIRRCPVCADRDRAMQPDVLDCFAQKDFRGFDIASQSA